MLQISKHHNTLSMPTAADFGLQELTGGASLKANIKLVKNNAAVGSRIAVALAAEAQE